jgi:hypothetical protein
MAQYKYDELKNGDIRVLDILPGDKHDGIRFQIAHIPMVDPIPRTGRLSRAELQATLPSGWEVFETPEGRYLFCYDPEDDSSLDEDDEDEAEFLTTWVHPDTTLSPENYELPPDEQLWKNEPPFEALSYVWGPQDKLQTATVESTDGTTIGTFQIGPSLASAIRHLRYGSKIRRLWVDAICINQNDDAEKAIQVSRMNVLYSLATRVVAWLGEEEDDSSLAVSTLTHLGKQVETTLDGFRLTSPGADEPEWYNIDVDLPYDERTWDAIDALVSRSWFSRVWTAQEILLANRLAVVQCGSASISWMLFRRALECILDKSNIPSKCRSTVSLARTSVVNGSDRPLHQVLGRHSHRQCFNPRDKIYGMLGMAPPAFRAATMPNYRQSCEDTYRDAFLANSSFLKRWELFGCDVADRSIKGPSWVPDLIPEHTHSWSSRGQFAAGSSELHMTYHAPDKLEVLGLCFAKVETVGSLVPNSATGAIRVIRSWFQTGEGSSSTEHGEAAVISLVQGCLRERYPKDDGWPTLREWKMYCKNKIFTDGNKGQKFTRSNHLDNLLFSRCEGRVFVRTQGGHVGLGPKDTQKGDVVCVVLGCDQPLVLRPLPNGLYLLVGTCFVSDLQDYQGLLGPLPSPWRVQVFDDSFYEFRRTYKFFNPDTKQTTWNDPRLPKLGEWDHVPLEDLGRGLTGDDPEICEFFRHKTTGQVVNSDPRLAPEELAKRGLVLETLAIV